MAGRERLSSPGIWLVTYEKAAGERYLPYDDIVRAALAYGWIDGKARRLDDLRSQLLLTLRKPTSKWSRPNKLQTAELEAAGLMAAVVRRSSTGWWRSAWTRSPRPPGPCGQRGIDGDGGRRAHAARRPDRDGGGRDRDRPPHPSCRRRAVDSCVLWSEAVRRAVVDGVLAVADGIDLLPPARRDRWAERVRDAEAQWPVAFNPNGWTVTALQATWSAVSHAAAAAAGDRFRRAVVVAVRAGDDTDTVAAVAGGLAGARWGVAEIPGAWRRAVHGWPGLRANDLGALAVATARLGRDE